MTVFRVLILFGFLLCRSFSLSSSSWWRQRNAGKAPGHRRKEDTHNAIVSLLAHHLILRRDPDTIRLHREVRWSEINDIYFLRSGRPFQDLVSLSQTPDIVLADMYTKQILVFEVTVVPEPALAKYVAHKQRKYDPLTLLPAQRGEGQVPEMAVLPPIIVAFSTAGAVASTTYNDLEMVQG